MKQGRKKILTTKSITMTAVFAALSTGLYLLEFPLPIFPSMLKFDFSDLPALIGSFIFGPAFGVVIELFKNVIHMIFFQKDAVYGVGELANFLIGVGLVVPAGFIYKYKRTFKGALLGLLTGTLCIAIAGIAVNLFILFPLYMPAMPFADRLNMIFVSFLPFNLLKGTVISIVTLVLYKHLKKLIDRMFRDSEKDRLKNATENA